MRAGVLYAATFRKGIQVVDLGQVKDAFKAPGTSEFFQMSQAFLTDGRGYGQENVVNIQVTSPFGEHAHLNDIEAALTQTRDGAQLLVAAAGDPGLTVVNPGTQSVLWNDKVTYERDVAGQKVVEATLRYGQAIALGNVAGQDLAVVVGSGTILQETQNRPLLMVVSLYDPQNPVGLGYMLLDDATVGDVILKDDLALLGGNKQVTLVSLTDKTRPKVLGTVSGVGGRLALSEGSLSNILFSTAHSVFGGATPLGGIRVATLGSIVLLLDKDKKILPRIKLPKNTDTYVRALVPAAGDTVEGVEVSIIEKDGNVRKKTGTIPTQTTLTLKRDPETGQYLAPLKIVDKDCALALEHDKDTDEQRIQTSCKDPADTTPYLESGPWTKLKITLPEPYRSLDRVVDIRAFRLVAIGDSLTQGVQHGVVVHQDQHYSFPAQIANQINKLLAEKYQDKNANAPGPKVVFRQPMIAEPAISKPPLGNPWGDGNGKKDDLGFPVPGRLNPDVQPVNNLGISGARALHLYTSKKGNWQPYCLNVSLAPPFCDSGKVPKVVKEKLPDPNDQSVVWDADAPKSVWPYTLLDKGTPVEQAAALDPSLLIVQAGNNDALNAAVASDLGELTPIDTFREQYDKLIGEVKRMTQGRADVIVVTIPDVETIPHMRSIGQKVGALPFTLPLPGPVQKIEDEVEAASNFEFADLPKEDLRTNECLGKTAADGTCLGGPASGAKIGLATIFKGRGKVYQGRVVLFQKKIELRRSQVLNEGDLNAIREHVRLINEHILKRASENGFVVFDANRLFAERTDPKTLNDPTQLNGLFTGTPVPGHPLGRGYGNTLLGWDGVHPNSAGYALAANATIDPLNKALKDRDIGLLEKGSSIPRIASGSKDEEGTITWLLVRRYIDLKRSHLFRDLISKVE